MSKATLDDLKLLADIACAVVATSGQVMLVHNKHEHPVWEGVPEHYRKAALDMGYVWDTEADQVGAWWESFIAPTDGSNAEHAS